MFVFRSLISSRVVLALLATVFLNVALAGAHRGGSDGSEGSGKGPGNMRHMQKMGSKLDLTDTQQQDFIALLDMYKPRFEEIIKRGKPDRDTLLEMAPDDSGYDAQVKKVSDEAGKSAAETVTLLAELQGLVYALLTSEQQQTYLELRAKQRSKMQRHKGKRGKHSKGHKCGKGKKGKKKGEATDKAEAS
jgi:Spy/CpxP family protein refolding chaperone